MIANPKLSCDGQGDGQRVLLHKSRGCCIPRECCGSWVIYKSIEDLELTCHPGSSSSPADKQERWTAKRVTENEASRPYWIVDSVKDIQLWSMWSVICPFEDSIFSASWPGVKDFQTRILITYHRRLECAASNLHVKIASHPLPGKSIEHLRKYVWIIIT